MQWSSRSGERPGNERGETVTLALGRSDRSRVLITRKLPEPAEELLRPHFDVTYVDTDEPLSEEKLTSLIHDKHGVVCSITEKIDRAVLDAAAHLRVVSTMSVGYDHVDVGEATRRGIAVTNTPDVLTDATADLTFALLLGVARRIAEGHSLVSSGSWKGAWSPFFMVGTDLAEKTLGILGMGRIGAAVARRAKGFGMRLIYHKRSPLTEEEEAELGVRYRSLDRLLEEADYLTVHLPLSDDTLHLMDAKRLALMKPTAFLINTSRGPVVDESALADAVGNGRIAGAALDVYGREPLPEASPLLSLDNVLLSPHTGSATEGARRKMAEVAATNLRNVLQGKKPLYQVNPEVS